MYKNIVELIGNTPMIKLKKEKGIANIYVKLEKFNPSGSIKDRAALQMIVDAEKCGQLKKGNIILEPTSGNTGVALAMIGKAMGYEVTLIMPSSMSQERKDIISSYGANLILTNPETGMKGAIDKAYEMVKNDNRYYIPNQFENKSNIDAHYHSTGVEIYNELPEVDAFVAGVGTGGTLGGIGKYLKECNQNIQIIAVEPSNSAVLSGKTSGIHKIQGIGAGFIPKILDISIIDEIITIDDKLSYKTTRDILDSDGLYLGISSGANIAAARILAKKLGEGKTVITIAPDGGEKYLSTGVFTKQNDYKNKI